MKTNCYQSTPSKPDARPQSPGTQRSSGTSACGATNQQLINIVYNLAVLNAIHKSVETEWKYCRPLPVEVEVSSIKQVNTLFKIYFMDVIVGSTKGERPILGPWGWLFLERDTWCA
jgi:hypothetical protein